MVVGTEHNSMFGYIAFTYVMPMAVLLLMHSSLGDSECVFNKLVFRGASSKIGGNGSIYDLWSSSLTHNEHNPQATNSGYGDHYKASDVEEWDTNTFDRIRLSVLSGGVEHAYLMFNAVGSNKMSWMSKSRLIESSYGSIGTTNYFSIKGDNNGKSFVRRFFINQHYGGCGNDVGWLVVSEGQYCQWEQVRRKPHILVSLGAGPINWLHGKEADEIAIYVSKGFGNIQKVPNLPFRNPSWIVGNVDDRYLVGGIYSAGDNYDIVTEEWHTTGCGSQRQVWMNDTIPNEDGSFHSKNMCVLDIDTDDACKHSFTMDVLNCGDFRLYDLKQLSGSQYGDQNQSISYCFDLSVLNDPCSQHVPPTVPDLESRRPSNTLFTNNDVNLVTDWYSAGQYQMLTYSPALNFPGCGANSQIWLNGSLPEADGHHHTGILCVTNRATNDTCDDTSQNIFIKNCETHYMYFLPASVRANSSYCFDIPTDSDVAAPGFVPSNAIIDFDIQWIRNGMKWKPSLRFKCIFQESSSQRLFYAVYFYIDGKYIRPADLVVQHSSDAYITEEDLYDINGYVAGITISCSVGARMAHNGRTGPLITSVGFYAGIKMTNHSLGVERGGEGVVHFYQTVPFGCFDDEPACSMRLQVIEKDGENHCSRNTIKCPNGCSIAVEGLSRSDYRPGHPWLPVQYQFNVVTSDSQNAAYQLAQTEFVLQLRTPTNLPSTHRFWQDSVSDSVNVNVYEAADSEKWKQKRCEIHCDPHMLTFDGLRYELHEPGKYLLLQSNDPPVKVQMELTPCLPGSSVYCACGLVVVAGQDIFEVYTCNGQNILEFKSCGSHVLKAERVTTTRYQIFLPTGAVIHVHMRKIPGYKDNLLDIDIIPTIHEYTGQIWGLCGNPDGDKCNDCVAHGGSVPCADNPGNNCEGGYLYHPNVFTQSYRLNEEDSFLNKTPDPNSLSQYPESYQLCNCPENEMNFNDEVSLNQSVMLLCSLRLYVSCVSNKEIMCRLTTTNRPTDLTQQLGQPNSNTPGNDNSNSNVGKRSVPMTENEARDICTMAMTSSATYTACAEMNIDSSELETCTVDLMITGDTTWAKYALDRKESACLDEVHMNTTLQEAFPELSSEVTNNTCPNSCCDKGNCSSGSCICDKGYASEDCSYDLSAPLTISGLANDGLCDLRYYINFIVIKGYEFPADRNYTCQFQGQMVFINNSALTLEDQNVTARYQTLFDMTCGLPVVPTLPEHMAVQYSVAVAMDPYSFGTSSDVVVINTECQNFTRDAGRTTFYIKRGYCYIDAECVAEGTHLQNDTCLECVSATDVYLWTKSTDCTANLTESDPGLTIIIVCITVPVFVVVVVLAVCVYASRRQKSVCKNNISQQDNSPMTVYVA